MSLQFIVGDTSGRILTELTPDIGEISWRLSDVGQVSFGLATRDTKATQSNLQFGNRVLIHFDNGLPDWGGVIDPPRDWSGGIVACNAYSAEYIFSTRVCGKNKVFTANTVGDIYSNLIDEANDIYSTGIEIGSVYLGGNAYSKDYHYTELLSIFREYLTEDLSDFDFDVTAMESSGRILFTANLYQRKGRVINNFALVEGMNMEVSQFGEQGKIVNGWFVAGKGNTWDDLRLVGNARDSASVSTYGYREGSAVHSDTDIQSDLDNLAAVALAANKDPHNMIGVLANDNLPARFADYGVGDSLRLVADSVGFGGLDTTARVISRGYDPNTGLCQLVMREEL